MPKAIFDEAAKDLAQGVPRRAVLTTLCRAFLLTVLAFFKFAKHASAQIVLPSVRKSVRIRTERYILVVFETVLTPTATTVEAVT